MASLFPDLENDIFISYRQNDNKYDGWVEEFVFNLNKELESTIKEKITVYFDGNPHDGLLETHNIDKSLSISSDHSYLFQFFLKHIVIQIVMPGSMNLWLSTRWQWKSHVKN